MGRYSKVFSLPQNLYATGSPVLIVAGALQKDNQSGKVLAQLKLKNIASQTIKAVKVSILPYDTAGKPLGETVSHSYLDLNATRDSEFGQKTPITLPDSNTRSFAVTVDEVVYVNNTTWTANGEPWETLHSAQALQSNLTFELAKQFKIEFGGNSKNLLCEQKDLWICSCGEINRADETACHRCKNSLSALRSIDFTEMQKRCDERVAKEEEQKKEAAEAAEKQRKKLVKIAAVSAAALVVIACISVFTKSVIIPTVKYNNAVKLMENGSYDEAVSAFQAMGDYKDSANKLNETKYQKATSFMESGNKGAAAILFSSIDFEDSKEQGLKLWNEIADRSSLSGSYYHTVGLKSDGTVVATGYNKYGQCDVSDWTDIVAISADGFSTVGLKSDGTVVATGDNEYKQCNVSDWTDIVAISAEADHTVGLKSDGTVVATGSNDEGQCDVSEWSDIVAISIGEYHTVGLKVDGTVVATGDNFLGCCEVSDWKNIVSISVSHYNTVGLKSDGTVISTDKYNREYDPSDWNDIVAISDGYAITIGLKSNGTVVVTANNGYDQCNVSDWTDIVAVSDGTFHAVGLKSDGTVVATGLNKLNQCDVSDWRDIVAILACESHTLGLKSDGTVVATGRNDEGQCDVSDWTNIKVPN